MVVTLSSRACSLSVQMPPLLFWADFFSPGFRRCTYTNTLNCRKCQTGQRRVVPAKAVWHWDLQMHPVSDRAAEFIDSVADKPIICVSALHPNLYTLVCATRTARGHGYHGPGGGSPRSVLGSR